MTVRALLAILGHDAGPERASGPSADRGQLDIECRGVTSDSRAVVPGGVFVALQGQKFDGTQFVPEAIANGAVAIVSQRTATVSNAPWVVVPDTRAALATLAATFYGQPSHELR